MVEYILLVVVVITMAFAIGTRLFKPFNEWANHYIGHYVECLLDYGEVPSLGGSETISDCDISHQPFTIVGGRSPKTDASKSNAANQNRGGSGGNGRSGSGNVAYRNSGGRSRSAIGSGFDGAGKASNVIQLKTADASLSANGRNTNYNFPNSTSRSRSASSVATYKGFAGLVNREQEKIKKREEKVRSVSRGEGASGIGSTKKNTFPVEFKERKQKEPDLAVGDWSIGNLVRTLLIIVIVIALALFLAGQLAQISKSMEKG